MWIFSKKYMDKLPNYVQVGSPLEFTKEEEAYGNEMLNKFGLEYTTNN